LKFLLQKTPSINPSKLALAVIELHKQTQKAARCEQEYRSDSAHTIIDSTLRNFIDYQALKMPTKEVFLCTFTASAVLSK
jgi:hypothetical protein